MTIQKADPTQITLQNQITQAVTQRVADQATYTIRFGRDSVTAISAKGAEGLYEQCVMQNLCPEIQLEKAVDQVVGGQWIVDGVWRATWKSTGETFTIDARGSEPYDGPNNDRLGVANRKAMGKARRNAHLSAVPSIIREAFLDHLKKSTGKNVVHSEEYVPSPSQTQAQAPADTARSSGRRQSTRAAKEKQPHEVVYEHIASKWKKNPADCAMDIFTALNEQTLPGFLENGTAEEAISLIDNYWQNGGSAEPVVVTAVEDEEQVRVDNEDFASDDVQEEQIAMDTGEEQDG